MSSSNQTCFVTYKEQQSHRKEEFLTNIPSVKDGYSEVYDIAVRNTEEVFLERLRNKLSPIVNLIEISKELYECEDLHKKNKLYDMINKLEPWKSAEKSVQEILDIINV